MRFLSALSDIRWGGSLSRVRNGATGVPSVSRMNGSSSIRFASYKRFSGNSQPINIYRLLYNRNSIYVGMGLVGFYIYNLDEAPFTHRRRFLWIPYWMEKKIGDYSYSQILYQYQNQVVPARDPIYGKISTIMNRLLTVALTNDDQSHLVEQLLESQRKHLKNLDWTIHVVKVDAQTAPNAFILPNGKIFIFSSILPICRDDDGLATVLSHELSHQLAHHSSEQLSLQPFYILLSTALYTMTGISWFNDLLIEGLLRMPTSREMESEADRIGCELLARLCFNVELAVDFWLRMQKFEESMGGQARGGMLQEFLSTHPATTKRIKDIRSWLPELENVREASGCHQWRSFNTARNFFGQRI